MTAWPRALSGPVMNMARPRRPAAEVHFVHEGAAILRAQTGLTSAKAQSREIARRVSAALLIQVEMDPLDLAFAAIEGNGAGCPFQQLAADPEIDTVAEFTDRRVERLRSRAGRYLPPAADAAERRAIIAEIEAVLANRYDHQLRGA